MKAILSRAAAGLVTAALSLACNAVAAPPAGVSGPDDAAPFIETLSRTDASTFEKARACQQLAIVGSPDAVRAIAPLLSDPQLGAYARAALEQIPGDAPAAALRDALDSLSGGQLVGVINSLGVRKDANAVPGLSRLATGAEDQVAVAALIALGRIGTPDAIALLRGAFSRGPHRDAVAEALVWSAENALANGRSEEALSLYNLLEQADLPRPLRIAVTRGALLARGPAAEWPQFTSADPAIVEAAIAAARELPDARVTRALAAALGEGDPPRQARLIAALAERSDASEHAALLERLATAHAAEVRIASLEALGNAARRSSIPVLLKALSSTDATESRTAASSLVRAKVPETDTIVLEALASAPSDSRARLLSVLGERQSRKAVPALLRHASSGNTEVARAAFDALAATATLDELPDVISAAVAITDSAVRDRAESALYTIALRQDDPAKRSRPFAAAYRRATGPEAAESLLEVLAMLGDRTAAETIAEAYRKDQSPVVRETALRLLAHWSDPTPAPLLLDIFKAADDPAHRALALRGLVMSASQWKDHPEGGPRHPPAEMLSWLREARAAIRDVPEEKRLIISGLADLSSIEGIELVEPYLDDPQVARDAALAIIRAAGGLAEDARRRLRPLIERIAATSGDNAVRQQAAELLRR